MTKSHSDIGLIGLAVMGQNLALNIADHGFQISVYNRTTEKTDKFVAENPNTPGGVVGTKTLEEFVKSLAKPRKMVILVQAGKPTDAVIDGLVPLLEAGDIVIDGGNALWTDTIRREKALREKNLRFIGSGVSGGEEGARFGPALMPGGDAAAYKELAPIWNAVAAKVDAKTGKPLVGATPGKPIVGGVPCSTYIGENGAGHYVKMVHNGIDAGEVTPQEATRFLGKSRDLAQVVAAFADDREVLEAPDRYELMTLEGEKSSSADDDRLLFHQYPVKATFSIPGRRGQLELTRAVYLSLDATQTSDAWSPTHGIRATKAGRSVDLIISFEEGAMIVFRGKNESAVLPISSAPQELFDAMMRLRARKVPELDEDSRDVLEHAESIALFAIDPGRGSAAKGFDGYPIRRQRELTRLGARVELVETLYAHVGKAEPGKGWKPRHALRAASMGATVELALSLDTSQLQLSPGGAKPKTVGVHPGLKDLLARLVDRESRDEVIARLGPLHAPVAARLSADAMALLEDPDQIEVIRYATDSKDDLVVAQRIAVAEADRPRVVEAALRAIGGAPESPGELPEKLEGAFYMMRFQHDATELRLSITPASTALWSVQPIDGNAHAAPLALAAPAPLVEWLEKQVGRHAVPK